MRRRGQGPRPTELYDKHAINRDRGRYCVFNHQDREPSPVLSYELRVMNLPKANVMRALCARYDMIAGEEKRCRKATHNLAKTIITHNLPQAIIVGCNWVNSIKISVRIAPDG